MQIQQGFARRSWVAGLLVGAIVVGSLSPPRRADAAIAALLASWGGSTLGGGVALLAGAGSTAGAVLFAKRAWNSRKGRAVVYALLAVGCAVGAFYMLDAPEKASGELRHLSRDEARALGMSEAEHAAYEAELPQLNAVREEVILRVAREFPEGSVNSLPRFEAMMLRLHQEWNSMAPAVLDREAVAAVGKLSESLRSKL
jgi:hypothetical protein